MRLVFVLAFGAVFLYAGAMKALHFEETAAYLATVLHAQEGVARTLAGLLLVVECGLGAWILLARRSVVPVQAGVLLMIVFVVWALLMAFAGEAVACACFGVQEQLLEGRWSMLLRNLVLLAVGLAALKPPARDDKPEPATQA